MSKAILIRDMPENCFQCELWHTTDEGDDLCGVNFKTVNPIADERPDWCPLIPEPERLAETWKINFGGNPRQLEDKWAIGWNACLDALEGKT